MKSNCLKGGACFCLLLTGILLLWRPAPREVCVEEVWQFDNQDVPPEFPQIFLYMDNITLYEDNTFIQEREGKPFITGNYYRTKSYIKFTTIKIGGIPNRNTYRLRYYLEDGLLILEKGGRDLKCFV